MTAGTSITPKTDNQLRLSDGRILGYAEYGDPEGAPVFFFHGMPGSRLEGALGHDAAVRHHVRVISTDRPGYGLSTFQPKRTFLDWPGDVTQLAGSLGIDRFAIAGISGGGPYVAVCALQIPQRLTHAVMISGVGPFDVPGATQGMSRQNRMLFAASRRAPILVRVVMAFMARSMKRSPDRFMDQMLKSLPEPDRKVLADPALRELFKQDALESMRPGARGAAYESVMYARPWGFRLEDITMPVTLWQGDADVNVPVVMGRYQATAIPNCDARFFPGEGHMLIFSHMDELFALTAR
jgi:pimeloyl-ACP methyl ester carboxylesterase